jgi:disulfide bond formation protein DsbB
MVHSATVLFALGAVAMQVVAVLVLITWTLSMAGLRSPAKGLRGLISGYELWQAAALSLSGTAVSLFFTEFADFFPGEIGWYTRICMYPLSITTVLAALADDRRAARYLLPFPLVGISLSVYGILLENHVVAQSRSCQLSGPGGCTAKWIDEFGYVTIPVMALSSFFLIAVLLYLAGRGPNRERPRVTFPHPLPIVRLAILAAVAAMAWVAIAAATTASPSQTRATSIVKKPAAGNAAAGRQIFLTAGCSGCHTLAAAGSTGTAGPNLDDVRLPLPVITGTVTNGRGSVMSPFAGILSPTQIANVAAFVYQAEHH